MTNIGGSYTIPTALAEELRREAREDESITSQELALSVAQNDYNKQRYNRVIDFNLSNVKSYKEVMQERELEREEVRVTKLIDEAEHEVSAEPIRKKKKRWDVTPDEYENNNLLIPRNKVPIIKGIPLTDEILDKILPPGYVKVQPPIGYVQTDDNAPDVTEVQADFYLPPADNDFKSALILLNQIAPTDIPGVTGLQHFKTEDIKYFGKLLTVVDSKLTTTEEKHDIQVMRLLLKIKNGTQIVRKRSLRQLTDSSKKFGPKILFSQILPLLVEPTLEEQERQLLVKLIGRVLFQVDHLVRPYTSKILMVISPLLIDEDFTLRQESREIIANLTKAAGLANMISNLRPDLDHADEYIRNITSRVFAIVASTLGLTTFLPFLKAVIKSKKNWMARHTGIKIVQQLCLQLGSGSVLLPHLTELVELVSIGLVDEILQVKIITGLTLSQLADNVSPYGMESFEPILEPVWYAIKKHRGKGLASFLKCIGSIIPLMTYDPNYEEYSNYYSKELIGIITREFGSPDEDMKKTILKILISLPLSKDIVPDFKTEILDPFLKFFWNRRTASDSNQIVKLVVDATVEISKKLQFVRVLQSIILHAKDNNEPLRKMAVEAIHKMVALYPDNLIGIEPELEVKLVDAILFAFQEQTTQHRVYLQVFGSVSNALNARLKPHLDSIISTILYRIKNKSPEIRQQAADLIPIIAPVIKQCSRGDDDMLMKLILILYESLGEAYPEVLGSLISALHACIDNVDKSKLFTMNNPSINQILPTLTPILKNRQEKVQESCIRLIGLIAQKNGESINAKEWMRICFELLEMLKSTKKRIRLVANETFGHIAKTIGPQDIIVMLLNNLRVQERQLRVCTAVAIGIVAETCLPFTVLPSIMNEYKIPEKNVQNGILKSLSFLFEYIDGRVAKDYIYGITPLIEDALIDRDHVHRQIASSVIKHLSLNCYGRINNESVDVFMHFLNLLLPNIYETSPHVIERILESIDSIRIVIGVGIFSNYLWAGLFHPARKVRQTYWKMYNNVYIQGCDSLVPYYPRIVKLADDENDYSIEELDIML